MIFFWAAVFTLSLPIVIWASIYIGDTIEMILNERKKEKKNHAYRT